MPVAHSAPACAATPPRFVVTCARGSSDSAATYAKYLIEIRLGVVRRLGRPVGQLDLPARRSDARRAVPRDLAVRPQPRPPGARRGGARRRRADRRDRQRRRLRRWRRSARSCCRSTPGRSEASRRPSRTSPRSPRSCSSSPTGAATLPSSRPPRRLPDALVAALCPRLAAAVAPLAAARDLYVVGRGVGLARGAGSGAEVQGDLRHPCARRSAPPS